MAKKKSKRKGVGKNSRSQDLYVQRLVPLPEGYNKRMTGAARLLGVMTGAAWEEAVNDFFRKHRIRLPRAK